MLNHHPPDRLKCHCRELQGRILGTTVLRPAGCLLVYLYGKGRVCAAGIEGLLLLLVWLCHKSFAADQGQSLIDLADQITVLNCLTTQLAEWLDVGQIAQRKFDSYMI